MSKKYKIAFSVLVSLIIIALLAWYLHGQTVAVLNPEGPIASKERNLIIFTVLLGLVVIIPVFALTIFIAWKYREGNENAKRTPDWDSNRPLEILWWAIPGVIILILSVVTWLSSYDLSPYKALVSTTKPITIQVVALDWKWLFIYPQQDIATVNFFQIPVNTPINFNITSDAPMNSFWIPQLGGQIYAMPGMSTQLHLMATKAGSYYGSSANISGDGFAGMTFTARARPESDFTTWLQSVRQSPNSLTPAEYASLAKPSENNSVAVYASVADNLYNDVIMKYMMPSSQMSAPNKQPTSAAAPGASTPNMNTNSGSNKSSTMSMPSMPGMKM